MMKLLKKIVIAKYEPCRFLTRRAEELLKKLLEVDPNKRITLNELKKDPWLRYEEYHAMQQARVEKKSEKEKKKEKKKKMKKKKKKLKMTQIQLNNLKVFSVCYLVKKVTLDLVIGGIQFFNIGRTIHCNAFQSTILIFA